MTIRQMIFDVAAELGIEDEIEETLKWGEPAYLAKKGSTLRIDWKPSTPNMFYMFFNCRTSLVETFKELYRDEFNFAKSRAIVFNEDDDFPENELKNCISMSLNYHNVKHLPLLGA